MCRGEQVGNSNAARNPRNPSNVADNIGNYSGRSRTRVSFKASVDTCRTVELQASTSCLLESPHTGTIVESLSAGGRLVLLLGSHQIQKHTTYHPTRVNSVLPRCHPPHIEHLQPTSGPPHLPEAILIQLHFQAFHFSTRIAARQSPPPPVRLLSFTMASASPAALRLA